MYLMTNLCCWKWFILRMRNISYLKICRTVINFTVTFDTISFISSKHKTLDNKLELSMIRRNLGKNEIDSNLTTWKRWSSDFVWKWIRIIVNEPHVFVVDKTKYYLKACADWSSHDRRNLTLFASRYNIMIFHNNITLFYRQVKFDDEFQEIQTLMPRMCQFFGIYRHVWLGSKISWYYCVKSRCYIVIRIVSNLSSIVC